ncbi:hypothetical protein T484DRAFT_1915746 [Baffinella frigidus]|nr:hypothetical protein T484DRAFT_1915746 [Cryptophyta sp. CCMP2293]
MPPKEASRAAGGAAGDGRDEIVPEVIGVSSARGHNDALLTAFGTTENHESMLRMVGQIRETQLRLFQDHMALESQPGPGIDLLGTMDDAADAGAAETRFKPLAEWFETKETNIEQLTTNLESVCAQMQQLNHVAATSAGGSDRQAGAATASRPGAVGRDGRKGSTYNGASSSRAAPTPPPR